MNVDDHAGLDEVRRIALAWAAGNYATRDEALDDAVEAILEARLACIPRAALERTVDATAEFARRNPELRARVSRLLDWLAVEG